MRFPTGSEVTKLRTRYGQRSKVYLGVQRGKERTDNPPALMVGQHYALVAADAYDADEHTLDWSTVNFLNGSDIRPNMTLAVGTLVDPFLHGSARIRFVDAGNNRLCLEPNNLSAEGYLATGDYIWVDGVYRLYRILPHIVDGTVYEDGNPDTLLACGVGNQIPGCGIVWDDDYYNRPVALMGSPRPAFAGEPINFYGWRSHGRSGRSIQNWTWDFDGGVCEGPGIGFPGSPASPIRARWDEAGEYVASFVVEDDSGNAGDDAYGVQFNRHRAVRPVLVFDRPGRGDNPPYTDFEISSLTGRYGSGWSCRITVFGTADKSEFPDNALIILFCEDWYGGALGSIGGWYGQENILFVGHIRADSVEVDSEKSTVSFEADTIEQWMKEIDVWPANFSDPAAAANEWHEFDDMAIEDCLWHLAEVHSNLKDVTDVFFASDVNAEKDVDFLDLTEASLYDQMSSQIGSCFFGQLSASRHGSVHLSKHKNMLDIGERAWWGPPVYSFSRQDWRDELQIGEERQRDSVAQVDFIGFVYDATGNPLEVYSLAPERQTNFGGIEKVSGILLSGNSIVAGQAENNTLSGLYRAWKNIRFPHVRVPAMNNRILEPATLDYFAIVLDPADTIRGYDWTGKEFLTTGISVAIDAEKGIILTEVEGEASTWGPDGVAGLYPPGAPYPDPPGDNPPGFWTDWPPGATPDNPDGDPPPWGETDELHWPMAVYMGLWSGHVIRATDVGIGHRPVYSNLGQVHSDGIYWMALDQFESTDTAMVCARFRVYKTTNLSADAPDWDLMFGPVLGLNGTNIEWTIVQSSGLLEGLWMVAGYEPTAPNARVYVRWTLNGGSTWYATSFTGGNATASSVFLEMSTHDANRAWTMQIDGTTGRTHIFTTNTRWASQTLTLIPQTCFLDGYERPCCHHRDFENDDDSEVLWGGSLFDAGPGMDYARIYQDATCADIYATDLGDLPHVVRVGCGDGTTRRWWALATDDDDINGFWVLDAGTWTEQSTWTRGGGAWESRDCRNVVGEWQSYVAVRDGTNWALRVSIDNGENWSLMQLGDWTLFLTAEGLGDPDVMCVCGANLLP